MKNFTMLAAAFATAAAMAQTADSDISVTIDGSPLESAKPMREEDRVLVPMRAIFEKMNAKVNFSEGAVTATKGEHTTSLNVGSDKALVDGRAITLPTPLRPMAGVVYVPLRFVAESLGATVRYEPVYRAVTIDSPADMVATTPPAVDGAQTYTPDTSAGTGAAPYTPDAGAGTSTPPAEPPVVQPSMQPQPEPPRDARPQVMENDATTVAEPGFDWLKIVPWIIGALVLAGIGAALMAARARQGGVIASTTDRD